MPELYFLLYSSVKKTLIFIPRYDIVNKKIAKRNTNTQYMF